MVRSVWTSRVVGRVLKLALPFFHLQHDPENNKACVPGGEDGNYIMYARATSGDKKNNRQFSPCSLKSVREVSRQKEISVSDGRERRKLAIEVLRFHFLVDPDPESPKGGNLTPDQAWKSPCEG